MSADMIGVFGHREMELAAMRIVAECREGAPINPKIFTAGYESEGFVELKEFGWIDAAGRPTAAFWARVRGRTGA